MSVQIGGEIIALGGMAITVTVESGHAEPRIVLAINDGMRSQSLSLGPSAIGDLCASMEEARKEALRLWMEARK